MPFFSNAVLAASAVASGTLAGVARGDINVGVTVSATGPAASLGIAEKNTIAPMPQTRHARVVPCRAARCARRRAGGRRAHGIFNTSPTAHLGLDQRARVMVGIENGAWQYQP